MGDAEQYLGLALAIWREAEGRAGLTLGSRHAARSPEYAAALNNLGAVLLMQERAEEALELFQELVAILDPQSSAQYPVALENMAGVYAKLGEEGKASLARASADAARRGSAFQSAQGDGPRGAAQEQAH